MRAFPRRRRRLVGTAASFAFVAAAVATGAGVATSEPPQPDSSTATPIKHLVVLFQENVPFDRYFGTYPHALNPAGELPPSSPRNAHRP
jgi:phospholipase C